MTDRHTLTRVISGGQTGADMAGLLAARELGIETGGTAPKGWKIEGGTNPGLADYGLVEHKFEGYRIRTRTNVRKSDLTLILAKDAHSPGTRWTIQCCEDLDRPYLLYQMGNRLKGGTPRLEVDEEYLRKSVNEIHAGLEHLLLSRVGGGGFILNVAGNRESACPGIARVGSALLKKLLPMLVGKTVS